MDFVRVEHIHHLAEYGKVIVVQRASSRGVDQDPVGVDLRHSVCDGLCRIGSSERHVHDSGVSVKLLHGGDAEHVARDQTDTFLAGQLEVGRHLGK